MGVMKKEGQTTIDILSANKTTLELLHKDPNNRDRSYEHFHRAFIEQLNKAEAERDLDYLTLHLFAYLASWGMLRGSTFSLQKDYLFHKPIIEILLDEKYKRLLDISWEDLDEDAIRDILDLKARITAYYKGESYISSVYASAPEIKRIACVHDVLVSKILLGSYSCVLAYDTNVRGGLKSKGLCQSFGKRSLSQLKEFAGEHAEELAEASRLMEAERGMKYSDMKLLDSYFFALGAAEYEKKRALESQLG